MTIPRKLVWSTFSIGWLFSARSGGVMLRCGVWKVIDVVLDALSESLLVQKYSCTLFSSVLMSVVLMGFSVVSSVVSSAYVMKLK